MKAINVLELHARGWTSYTIGFFLRFVRVWIVNLSRDVVEPMGKGFIYTRVIISCVLVAQLCAINVLELDAQCG